MTRYKAVRLKYSIVGRISRRNAPKHTSRRLATIYVATIYTFVRIVFAKAHGQRR